MKEEDKLKFKRRARRVFDAIDAGSDPSDVRQHKLRRASNNRLWYCGSGSRRTGPWLCVRRDSIGRLYVGEVSELPEATSLVKASPTSGKVKV